MRMGDFSYHRPETLAEASALGRRLGVGACYLAGGTEVLPDLKQGRDRVEHLIDLSRVADLREIRMDGSELVVGATASLTHVCDDPYVREHFAPLAEAARTVAGEQVRNQATIGGNFCRAVPCADTPPICIAGDATLTLEADGGSRTLAALDFFRGPRRTVLEPGELLTEIRIPRQPPHSGAAYERFSRRRGSALAVAAVAARIVLDGGTIADARVVLGAVGPTPLLAAACGRALVGEMPTAECVATAAAIAATEARPITDVRGTVDYRHELVEVLTRRALTTAARRAGVT